ncbi:MAG: virulence factor [Candidatus Reconcilbacillus cellulovorans]|uniref:Virulence factor n=1 Tax=Candidatus Reconcilbacillus cellulovorans TaxID=1906605 RepID=A0A2A6E136_9BACL|nr:MAG: virulence factor [Candidatus Reconcilbacillus cellulovorans]
MRLLSIEPTPSPHTMKLNVDETLPAGVRHTYTPDRKDAAPPLIRRILAIPGVKAVFRTADFLAVDRVPSGDWEEILTHIRDIFGATDVAAPDAAHGDDTAENFGEVQVFVQVFRGIPIQVRARIGDREARAGLPERFAAAVDRATRASPTLLKERRLEPWGVRYGDPEAIAREVAEEIDAAYDDDRLAELVERAARHTPEEAVRDEGSELFAPPRASAEDVEQAFKSADWKTRYAALLRWKPTPERFDLLERAIRDEHTSVRRLAAVYLSELRTPEAMRLLFEALKDPSAAVRRTVGDALSDWGDPAATGPMAEALRDPNKLVRWRAARFMYEVGDDSALEALRAAEAVEPEFEVRLQMRMAIERIERGEEASGTVWQQMTRQRKGDRS